MTLTEIAARIDESLVKLSGARKDRADATEAIAGLEVEIQQLTEQFEQVRHEALAAAPSVLPQH